jgi:hypothetical protein
MVCRVWKVDALGDNCMMELLEIVERVHEYGPHGYGSDGARLPIQILTIS